MTSLALGVAMVVTQSGDPAVASTKHSGHVVVLSAGSLQDLMQQRVGPAFTAATGYTLDNTSMGSGALATSIKGGTLQGDVFISASPTVDATLERAANGNWVSWYLQFASSPLVLGYNPASRFSNQIKSEPWYTAISQPGFLIGRTDPATDPKGALTVTALHDAAIAHPSSALSNIAATTSNVFPEQTLVGQLQAGQLDAGFFYAVEAAASGIKSVPLSGTKLAGEYTITILNKAPDAPAARAFLAFILSKSGRKILKENGIVSITPPKVSGRSSMPKSVKALL